MFSKASWSWIALWLGTTCSILWPAAVNGGAFWFPDTTSYIRGADAAWVVAIGSPSEWSDQLDLPESRSRPAPSLESPSDPAPPPIVQGPIISGRSIYYGMLIYLPIRWGGPWAAISVQALLVAAALVFCVSVVTRTRERNRLWSATAIVAAVVGLTPFAYYACLLMPDIWSGVTIMLLGLAIAYGRSLSRIEVAASWLTAAIATTFHSTHILLAVAVGIVGALVVAGRARRATALGLGGSAAMVGILASAVFGWVVEARFRSVPLSPPFLSARLSDNGLGVKYLRDTCPAKGTSGQFVLCDYQARLPQHSDNFLWSVQPGNGVFQLAPPADQRRIAAQDKQFFISVVGHAPVAYAGSVVSSTAQTLLSFDMINFNYHKVRREGTRNSLPPAMRDPVSRTRAMTGIMPTRFILLATIATSLASLAVVVLAYAGIFKRSGRVAGPVAQFAFILIAGLVANAVICGALSKPDARYQMRLQWLLPLAAIALMAGQRHTGITPARPIRTR